MEQGDTTVPVRDLRASVLEAAGALLVEKGDADRVTIAAICGRAGCTPPSVYHYFETKEHLLREVCTTALNEFSRALQRRIGIAESPEHELLTRGREYLAWGLANPAQYRVLFDRVQPARDPGSGPEPGEGLTDLMANVERCRQAGRLTSTANTLTIATALWATVHGLVLLGLTNPGVPHRLLFGALEESTRAFAVSDG